MRIELKTTSHRPHDAAHQTLLLLGQLQTSLSFLSAEITHILTNNIEIEASLLADIAQAIDTQYETLSSLNRYPVS